MDPIVDAVMLESLLGNVHGQKNEALQVQTDKPITTVVHVDDMTTHFDPSDPDSPYFYFGIPNVITFNDGIISQAKTGDITHTATPHSITVPNGLDHVKTLQCAKAVYAPKGKVKYTLTMSGKTHLPDILPFSESSITNKDDDLRLGAAAMTALDFSTSIVADFFLTNTGIWLLNERLPAGWKRPLEPPEKRYAAYTQVKRVGDRSPDDVHELSIEYDKAVGAIRWYVEDELVGETTTIGIPEVNFDTIIDNGGSPEKATPETMQFGWGQFTLLDAVDPNNPTNSATGLVKLDPEVGFYGSPTAFDDEANGDTSNRLFGQGTIQKIYRFKVRVD